jgi:hypothetical protein
MLSPRLFSWLMNFTKNSTFRTKTRKLLRIQIWTLKKRESCSCESTSIMNRLPIRLKIRKIRKEKS